MKPVGSRGNSRLRRIRTNITTSIFFLLAYYGNSFCQSALARDPPRRLSGRQFNARPPCSIPAIPTLALTQTDVKQLTLREWWIVPPPDATYPCTPCDTGVESPGGDSGPRDLVLASVVHSHAARLAQFMRSVRSACPEATVVLFAEGLEHIDVNGACGVTVIEVGSVRPRFIESKELVTHLLFAHFLGIHRNDFDRVIVCDPHAALFQADPFTLHWHGPIVGVAVESDRLIYGSVKGVLSLYSAIVDQVPFTGPANPEPFRVYWNRSFETGRFDRIGLAPFVGEPDEDFAVVRNRSINSFLAIASPPSDRRLASLFVDLSDSLETWKLWGSCPSGMRDLATVAHSNKLKRVRKRSVPSYRRRPPSNSTRRIVNPRQPLRPEKAG